MKMTANLHTHTWRCNHASGCEREYIENAIAAGLKVFGFSDHAPYAFPGDYYSWFRMKREQQLDYIETLTRLKEEYKDQIDIKIGYECEYYPDFFADQLKLLTRYPIDYIILGQHFIENEISGKYSGNATEDEDALAQYVDQVSAAMRTGVFTYLAHPDMFNYTGSRTIRDRQYRRLIKCAIEEGVPLEINLLGVRESRIYPHEEFFEICGEMGAEVCIGCDAHSPDMACDAPSYEKAMDMVKRYSLKLNTCPTLRTVRAEL